MMAFKPGADVDQQRKACRVRLRKAVLTKALDLPHDLLRKGVRIPAGPHALKQLMLELIECAVAKNLAVCRSLAIK